MRYLILFLGVLLASALDGQADRNPFDLTDRLPPNEQPEVTEADTALAGNPFAPRTPQQETASTTPAVVDPPERQVVFAHLLLLLTLASLWVLFRELLRQCMTATLNDNVMTQLYRRRSGGRISALWLCYSLFLLAAGLFVYLATAYFGVALGGGLWSGWFTAVFVVAAAVGFKILVLQLMGRIYGLRKELSRYVFVLMVFAILAGLLLVPLNLLVSYAPLPFRPYFIYGAAGLLGLLYLLHLLRGLFIANRYVGGRPLHFLLYLCAIEIAPLLLVYRYVSNMLV